MRITSGIARGRKIRAPKTIRPTQDRVREAYFSKVASCIDGCRFLDLFCGSGAVGIEAWSRGAHECILVDKSQSSISAAKKNVAEVSADSVICRAARVETFLKRNTEGRFDLIYADPPYDLADEPGFTEKILCDIRVGGWLASEGICAFERRAGRDAVVPEGWRLLDSRRYGKSVVDYYCQG